MKTDVAPDEVRCRFQTMVYLSFHRDSCGKNLVMFCSRLFSSQGHADMLKSAFWDLQCCAECWVPEQLASSRGSV